MDHKQSGRHSYRLESRRSSLIFVYICMKILVTMKKFLIICVLCLLSAGAAKAQAVYKTSSKSDANVKVYVTTTKSEADLVVYECSSKSEASGNQGYWYFVSSSSDAKKKVYFTDTKSDADIVIYYTRTKSEACWQNRSKSGKMD